MRREPVWNPKTEDWEMPPEDEAEETVRLTREDLRQVMREMGRRGGKSRAAKMPPAERSEAARKAVRARWEKRPGTRS